MRNVMNIKRLAVIAVGALMAVVMFPGGGPLIAAPPEQPPGLDLAIAAQEAHTPRLLAHPGVVGTAVGLTHKGGHAILVLAKSDSVSGIPGRIGGFPVQVVTTGEFLALVKPPSAGGPAADAASISGVGSCPFGSDGRCERPVPIGVSTGHPDITAGTLCCRVKKSDGSVYALSNNHVYANANNATLGDNVLQPGVYDGGTDPADAIGTLAAFKEIDFSGSCTNTIDAAIARTSKDLVGNSTPPDGYGIPRSQPAKPRLNQWVDKYGRTSGSSNGGCLIYALNATVKVGYDQSRVACFTKQIIVLSFFSECGLPGDSGSLFVTLNRNPVGLLFASDALGLFVIANPIRDVLSHFGVAVDGQ